MIPRTAEKELVRLAGQFKAIAVIGPRQSGKTTLTRHAFREKPYASLENPDTRRFALEDSRGFLDRFPDGAVLDEVQRAPELFSYLQQNLDEDRRAGKFILTGSNNFLLQENISQSLSGRIAYLVLLPFSYSEIGAGQETDVTEMLFKGLYPPLFDQPLEPVKWYSNYIRTYVERDVRQLKNITDLAAFDRFLRLCAGRTGQLLNMSSLAIETGVDGKTVSAWISVLESSFILFRLQPHHKNFNKRVVKMPKLYFYDTGLLCSLLGIRETAQIFYHPLFGSIFENFIVSEVLKHRYNRGEYHPLYFWRDSLGHEIDVVIEETDHLYPVEIKSGKTITHEYFKNLRYWQKLNGQPGGTVIYSGNEAQRRSDGIEVLPWYQLDKAESKELKA